MNGMNNSKPKFHNKRKEMTVAEKLSKSYDGKLNEVKKMNLSDKARIFEDFEIELRKNAKSKRLSTHERSTSISNNQMDHIDSVMRNLQKTQHTNSCEKSHSMRSQSSATIEMGKNVPLPLFLLVRIQNE